MKHSKTIMSVLAPACVFLLGGGQPAKGQTIITEIIRAGLVRPNGIAVDAEGNAYATGSLGNNVFKITSAGVITQIIDFTGDGAGNRLSRLLKNSVFGYRVLC